MDYEMNKEQLLQEIETVKGEIESVKSELDNVRAQLGEPSVENKEAIEAGVSPEGELVEQGQASEQGSEPEQAPAGTPDPELQAKELELTSSLVAKQMRLVALEKALNDVLAQEAMDDMSAKEEF